MVLNTWRSFECFRIPSHPVSMANEEPRVLRSEFKVMRMSYRTVWALLPLILSGCLSHTRRLQQSDLLSPALKPDVAQLVETINRQYRQISSLTVTFDVTIVNGYVRLRRADRLYPLSGLPSLFGNHICSAFWSWYLCCTRMRWT